MKKVFVYIFFSCILFTGNSQLVSEIKTATSFPLSDAVIYVDDADDALVKKSAELLQHDIEMVTGKKPVLVNNISKASSGNIIVIGTIEKSSLIKKLITERKINNSIKNKWEAHRVETITNPFAGFKNGLIIAGSDRRGTAYGVFEVSKRIGVSPWYWWADVPVKKRSEIFISANLFRIPGIIKKK